MTTIHISTRKIGNTVEEGLLRIGLYLGSIGCDEGDFSLEHDTFHTRAFTFDQDTHAMAFKLRFSDWVTTVEEEVGMERERYKELQALLAQQCQLGGSRAAIMSGLINQAPAALSYQNPYVSNQAYLSGMGQAACEALGQTRTAVSPFKK
ncbi:hypothetical protein [Microvirga pudoricolor]|uniref:hypothetical protein n=1 Tax=Microvirga pudoricolor TaxID=2778729 RepID=UPI00194E2258|nr:hypothetical protein [Microvirga pudoricolor]MBM6595577.1 hypothetical protein [Microvirga pudoricolor]